MMTEIRNTMNKGARSNSSIQFGGQQNQDDSDEQKNIDEERNPAEQIPRSKEYKKDNQESQNEESKEV